jgi:hypothetical protein
MNFNEALWYKTATRNPVSLVRLISIFLLMSLPRKRQRAPDIDVYIPDDALPTGILPSSVLVQRHTNYNSTSQSLSVSRTYYTMPQSPQKGRPTEHNGGEMYDMQSSTLEVPPAYDISGVILEDDVDDNGCLPHDWMDPNYADWTHDKTNNPVKRGRTEATVSLIACIVTYPVFMLI